MKKHKINFKNKPWKYIKRIQRRIWRYIIRKIWRYIRRIQSILEEPEDILKKSESILEESKCILKESETHIEFSNEAYVDLMIIVTWHKLNNKASNAIIKFFNKHSNLTISPLSKNIEKERKFMNNMTFTDLKFKKTFIISHNDNEYFLYH